MTANRYELCQSRLKKVSKSTPECSLLLGVIVKMGLHCRPTWTQRKLTTLILFALFLFAEGTIGRGADSVKHRFHKLRQRRTSVKRDALRNAQLQSPPSTSYESTDRLLFNPLSFGVPRATMGSLPLRMTLQSQTDKHGASIPSNDPLSALIAPSFNTAIAKLSPSMQSRMPPGAEYLGAVRHALNPQCDTLYSEGHRKIATRNRSRETTLILMDKQLHPLAHVFVNGDDWSPSAEDVRLHIHKNTVLASYMNYSGDTSDWNIVELIPDNDKHVHSGYPSKLHNDKKDTVTYYARALGPYIDPNGDEYNELGRNFAVFWRGRKVIVQRWLAYSMRPSNLWRASHTTSLNEQVVAPIVTQSDILPLHGIVTLRTRENMHNSGINLPLYDPITREVVFLSIGHGHATEKQHGALFGTHYFFYFVLLRSKAPFKSIAQSPPFCIPAHADPQKCDLIQFVMSAVLEDPGTVLLTYGVNDCESMAVRVAVEEIFRFAREGGVLHFL